MLRGQDIGPILAGQGIYEESSVPKARVGAFFQLGDRKFRYCKNGAAGLTAGKLVQSAAMHATYWQNIAIQAAAAAGSSTISLTLPNQDELTLTANQLADGYLNIYDVNSGVGEMYKIKSHPAALKNTTCTFTLYDELVSAVTTSGKVALSPCKYMGVIVSPTTTPTGYPVGIPLIGVTANYYFWCQVAGPAPFLCGAAATMGLPLVRSLVTAGALTLMVGGSTADTERVLAIALTSTATTKYGQCDLCIE